MNFKTFYKNQRELAETLNSIVDLYWKNELSEELLLQNINNIFKNNAVKFLKNDRFTTILQQQCGKKRLDVISKIINLKAEEEKNV